MTGDESTADVPTAQPPLLRVVSGNPTPEELAALVAVISAAASASGPDTDEPAPDAWSAPTNMHRAPMPPPGAGAWVQLGRR